MTAAAWAVFALCAAVCLFVYVGYPLVLLLVSRLRPRPIRRAAVRPPLTVVVPAFNEEGLIAAKLANTLAQDYPADRLEVVIVSDGSTDATVDIVQALTDPRLSLIERPREGKLAALAAGVAAARGEIVALTDANTLLVPGALAALVEPFADPEVGGACGRKRYRTGEHDDSTGAGESVYWGFDTWLKELESRAGSVFAADGALYALRRELFVAPADPAQADDIAISARVVLQGYRLVTEPRAVAIEPVPAEGRLEFARKVRVTNHSVRALLGLGRRLWTSGFYSFELAGHKLLRHLIPFFLIPLALASAVLAPQSWLARLALGGQLAAYGLGAVGFLLRRTRLGRSKPLALPYFFCLANAAALVGVLSILGGRRLAAWTPRGGVRGDDPGEIDEMHKILIGSFVVILLAATPCLLAQEEPVPSAPAPPPAAESAPEWEAGLGAVLFDNFFQAPDGEIQEDEHAVVGRLGGRTRLGAQQQWEIHGTLEHLAYEEFDTSDRLGLGGGWEQGRQEAKLETVFDYNRPSFDVGDEFDRADSLRFVASYAYGVTDFVDLGANADLGQQSFDRRSSKDSDLLFYGLFARFLADSVLSPEIGWQTGERDVEDPVEDYDEDALYGELTFTPNETWRGSLRYRHRDREYTFDDPASSNFGRDDSRNDWTLSLAARFARHFGWHLYGTYLDADSTKPSRIFESTTVSSWVSVRF